MAKHNYRVSLESEANPADIVDCLETAGFGVIEVAASGWNAKRDARTGDILAIVAREAHKPINEAVLTRKEIAREAGASVMFTTGLIKESSELPDVAAYIQRSKADRAVDKARAQAAEAVARAEAMAAARVPDSGNGTPLASVVAPPSFVSV